MREIEGVKLILFFSMKKRIVAKKDKDVGKRFGFRGTKGVVGSAGTALG